MAGRASGFLYLALSGERSGSACLLRGRVWFPLRSAGLAEGASFSAASLLKISWLQGAVAAAILVPRHLGKEYRKAAEAREPRKDQPRTHKGREQV